MNGSPALQCLAAVSFRWWPDSEFEFSEAYDKLRSAHLQAKPALALLPLPMRSDGARVLGQ